MAPEWINIRALTWIAIRALLTVVPEQQGGQDVTDHEDVRSASSSLASTISQVQMVVLLEFTVLMPADPTDELPCDMLAFDGDGVARVGVETRPRRRRLK